MSSASDLGRGIRNDFSAGGTGTILTDISTGRGSPGIFRGGVVRTGGILILYTNNKADNLLTGTLGGTTTRCKTPMGTTTNDCKTRVSVVGSCSLIVLTPRITSGCRSVGRSASELNIGLTGARKNRCVGLAHSNRKTLTFIRRRFRS